MSLSDAPAATLEELKKAAAKAAADQEISHESTRKRDDLIRRIYATGSAGYAPLARAANLSETYVKRIILKGDK